MTVKGGHLKQEIKEPDGENEVVLSISDWQKMAFQMRGRILQQLSEVAVYCRSQRKRKRPANSLKNQWARTEISALSSMLGGLKDVEIEILKSKIEVLENAVVRK